MAHAGVDIFYDLEAACRDVDVAILLSGVRPGGGREQIMARTVDLYRSIGAALEQHANKDVKVGTLQPNMNMFANRVRHTLEMASEI